MACNTGIITFQNANNYGAVLQAFALQTTLEKMKCDVSIINYDSPNMGLKEYQCKEFGEFAKKYLKLTDEYTSSHDIEADNFDLLIAGSDQIWNPHITGCDETYFLDFKKDNTRTASYAASIGIDGDELDSFTDFFANNLCRIDTISLRESVQKKFVSDLSGKKIRVNIDPTLLLNAEDYKNAFEIKPEEKKQIFMYSNNADAKMLDFVNLLSIHTGMPIKAVTRMDKSLFAYDSSIYNQIPIIEWIESIASSSIIITDSFHGLMFSLIFKKPFYIYTKKRSNISRITDILDNCGLKDRKLSRISSMSDVNYDIDFSKTDEFVENARKEALLYLEDIIQSSERVEI